MSCVDCQNTTPAPVSPCPEPCPPRGCAPYEYRDGDWLIQVNGNGCVTRSRVANNMPSGVYTNPTITVDAGVITAIASGGRVLQLRPEPCATQNGSVPEAPPEVVISPATCNLLSGGLGGLFAGLTFNQAGTGVSVTGCGTASSPLVISMPAAAVGELQSSTLNVTSLAGTYSINSVGSNYNACGTQIVQGIVKTYAPGPAVINGVDGITTALNAPSCTMELGFDWAQAKLPSRIITGVSCGNTFLNPASASPTLPAVWANIGLTVYGNRMHIRSPYPVTVYNAAGTAIGSGDGFIVYGTAALAYAALASAYSFAGVGAC